MTAGNEWNQKERKKERKNWSFPLGEVAPRKIKVTKINENQNQEW
jgi:hypothetical protein